MEGQQILFGKGDWIVHARYGVGQVEGMEKKVLDGEKHIFLKVKTFNCMYWLPMAGMDADRIRPVTSEYRLNKALKLIRQAPAELPKDHNKRQKAIAQVFKDTSLYEMACMIRDLHGRQAEARLNFLEEDALKKLRAQFVNEWAIVKQTDRVELEAKLGEALADSLEKRRGKK
jgi:RNA polymerase-interacting CarD/CdnL/TRCF family regulator